MDKGALNQIIPSLLGHLKNFNLAVSAQSLFSLTKAS